MRACGYKTVFLLLSIFLSGCAANHNSRIECRRGLDFSAGLNGIRLGTGTHISVEKSDQVVITLNQDATIISAENLNQETRYENGRPSVEIRKGDLSRPIVVEEQNKNRKDIRVTIER